MAKENQYSEFNVDMDVDGPSIHESQTHPSEAQPHAFDNAHDEQSNQFDATTQQHLQQEQQQQHEREHQPRESYPSANQNLTLTVTMPSEFEHSQEPSQAFPASEPNPHVIAPFRQHQQYYLHHQGPSSTIQPHSVATLDAPSLEQGSHRNSNTDKYQDIVNDRNNHRLPEPSGFVHEDTLSVPISQKQHHQQQETPPLDAVAQDNDPQVRHHPHSVTAEPFAQYPPMQLSTTDAAHSPPPNPAQPGEANPVLPPASVQHSRIISMEMDVDMDIDISDERHGDDHAQSGTTAESIQPVDSPGPTVAAATENVPPTETSQQPQVHGLTLVHEEQSAPEAPCTTPVPVLQPGPEPVPETNPTHNASTASAPTPTPALELVSTSASEPASASAPAPVPALDVARVPAAESSTKTLPEPDIVPPVAVGSTTAPRVAPALMSEPVPTADAALVTEAVPLTESKTSSTLEATTISAPDAETPVPDETHSTANEHAASHAQSQQAVEELIRVSNAGARAPDQNASSVESGKKKQDVPTTTEETVRPKLEKIDGNETTSAAARLEQSTEGLNANIVNEDADHVQSGTLMPASKSMRTQTAGEPVEELCQILIAGEEKEDRGSGGTGSVTGTKPQRTSSPIAERKDEATQGNQYTMDHASMKDITTAKANLDRGVKNNPKTPSTRGVRIQDNTPPPENETNHLPTLPTPSTAFPSPSEAKAARLKAAAHARPDADWNNLTPSHQIPSQAKRPPLSSGPPMGPSNKMSFNGLRSVPVTTTPSGRTQANPPTKFGAPRFRSRAERNYETLIRPFVTGLATGVQMDDSPLQDIVGPLAPEHYAALPPCSRASAKALIAVAHREGPSRVKEMEEIRKSRGKTLRDGEEGDPFFFDVLAMFNGEEPSWYELDAEMKSLTINKPLSISQPFPHIPRYATYLNKIRGEDLSRTLDVPYVAPKRRAGVVGSQRVLPGIRKRSLPSEVVVIDEGSDEEHKSPSLKRQISSANRLRKLKKLPLCIDGTGLPPSDASNATVKEGKRTGDCATPAKTTSSGNLVPDMSPRTAGKPKPKRGNMKLEVFLVYDKSGKVSIDWTERPVPSKTCNLGENGEKLNAFDVYVPEPAEELNGMREDANQTFFDDLENEIRAEESVRKQSHPSSTKKPLNSERLSRKMSPTGTQKVTQTRDPNDSTPTSRSLRGTGPTNARKREPDVICIDADDELDTIPTPTSSRNRQQSRAKTKIPAATNRGNEERRAKLKKAVNTLQEKPPTALKPESAEAPALGDKAVSKAMSDEPSQSTQPRRMSKRLRRPTSKMLMESSDSDREFRSAPDEDFVTSTIPDPPPTANSADLAPSPQRKDSNAIGSTTRSTRARAATQQSSKGEGSNRRRVSPLAKERVRREFSRSRTLASAEPVSHDVITGDKQRKSLRLETRSRRAESASQDQVEKQPEPTRIQPANRRQGVHEEEDMDGGGPGYGGGLGITPQSGRLNKSRELWRTDLDRVEQCLVEHDPGSPDISSSDGEIDRGTIGVLQRILKPLREEGRCSLHVDEYDENSTLLKFYKATRSADDDALNSTQKLRDVWELKKQSRMDSELTTGSSQATGAGAATHTHAITQQTTTAHATQQMLGGEHRGFRDVVVQRAAVGGYGATGHPGQSIDSVHKEDEGSQSDMRPPIGLRTTRMPLRPLRLSDASRDAATGNDGGSRKEVGTARLVQTARTQEANSHGSSENESSEDEDENLRRYGGSSKRARTQAKTLSARAKELQNRVCGEVMVDMGREVKKKVLKWASHDFSWFEEGAEVMEIVASAQMKRCARCSVEAGAEEMCEEEILLKLWKDMSWRKVRRMRHKAQD